MNPLRWSRPGRFRVGRLVILAVVGGSLHALALGQTVCGALANAYGPFDYRTQRSKLKIVEDYHFTPQVEALIAGKSSENLSGDISYLLRGSPNHHRGLIAITRLAERERSPQPRGLQYSVECYFDRAVRFAKDDTVVRVLYAQYMHRQKRTPEGLWQLKVATEFAGDNALSHFNIGLAYLELGDDAHALEQAHRTRTLGMDRPELEQQLKARGAWKDPTN